jgi:hypothetical protein
LVRQNGQVQGYIAYGMHCFVLDPGSRSAAEQMLHFDPANGRPADVDAGAGSAAVFQVASQFNCLEMIGPRVRPEDGITMYASDPTQGARKTR